VPKALGIVVARSLGYGKVTGITCALFLRFHELAWISA